MSFPLGWTTASLGEVVAADGVFTDGDWVESKDQDPDGDVRLVQLADVGDGVYRNRSARFLTSAKARQLGCTLLRQGDVLVARMPDPLGRACIFPGDPKPCVTVVDVCVLRTGTFGVDHRWLMYTLNAPSFRGSVAAMQSGSTRKRISRGNLTSLRLPVPPLAEQRCIVAVIEEHLSRLDAAVAGLKRVQAQLPRYRAAVLKAAVGGPACPRALVGDLAIAVEYGTSAKTSERGEVPVLRMGNIQDGRLSVGSLKYLPSDHDEFPDLLLRPGDVLFNRTNSAELVGKTAVYHGHPAPCSFASYLIRVRTGPRCLPDYLSLCINAPSGRAWVASVVSQQVGQANVNGSKLKSLAIPLPPVVEQTAIVAETDRLITNLESLNGAVEAALARAAPLRQTILRRAFSGQLVPQDPNDEPASVLLDRIRAGREVSPAPPRKRKVRATTR